MIVKYDDINYNKTLLKNIWIKIYLKDMIFNLLGIVLTFVVKKDDKLKNVLNG